MKRLANGRMPRGCNTLPSDDIMDVQTDKRIRSQPLSPFAAQILQDHPGLSPAEAKVGANTFLRCADYTAHSDQS